MTVPCEGSFVFISPDGRLGAGFIEWALVSEWPGTQGIVVHDNVDDAE